MQYKFQIGELLPCLAVADMEDDNATWQSCNQARFEGRDVWQFQWSEKGPNGKRIYRKKVIGTIEENPTQDAVRNAMASLIALVIRCGFMMHGNRRDTSSAA
jgi:hypothetical protein